MLRMGRRVAVQNSLDRALHLLDVRHSVDPADEAAGVVIRQDGRGLGAIFGEAGSDRLFIVVGAALGLVGAADAAERVDPGQLVAGVLAFAASGAGASAGTAADR